MTMSKISALLSLTLVAACATTGLGHGSPSGLAGSTWRPAELRSNGDKIGVVRPVDPSKYEMKLGADGTATMRHDCNRGKGQWKSDAANQISFTPLAMTRAMCLGGSLDARIARELGYVRSYMLERDRLTLNMMADGGSQTWTRVGD